MAHFAEIRTDNNEVMRVVVIDNAVVDAAGGDLSTGAENKAAELTSECEMIGPFHRDENGNWPDTYWKQTSYNHNFRKQYADVGGHYDPAKDIFVSHKPHPSWVLDENDDWQSPIGVPTTTTFGDGKEYMSKWDEDNQRWLGYDDNENEFAYDPSSDSWSATGNTLPS